MIIDDNIIKKICKEIINNYYDSYSGDIGDSSWCIYCECENNKSIDHKDIKHDNNCVFLLAKDILWLLENS